MDVQSPAYSHQRGLYRRSGSGRGTPTKVRVVKSKDESEWVKVENAHEALVSYEDFMAVKVMMQRDMRCSPDRRSTPVFRLPVLRRLSAANDPQDRPVEDESTFTTSLLHQHSRTQPAQHRRKRG